MVGGCVSTKALGTVSCSVPRDGCGSCACQSADRCDCLGVTDVLEPLISRLHGGTDADPKGGNPFWFPKLQAIRSQSTAALYQCESDDESGVRISSCFENNGKLVCVDVQQQLNSTATNNLYCFSRSTNKNDRIRIVCRKEQLPSAVTAQHTNEQLKNNCVLMAWLS